MSDDLSHAPVAFTSNVEVQAYEASTLFRGQHNGCPVHELHALADLPTQGMTIG